MARHLPASHLRLPKKGFATPMTAWMRGELRQWAREAILDEPAISPFLNRPEVEHLWNAFQRGQDNLLDLISVLFSFGLWARSRGAYSPVRGCGEYLHPGGGNQADWPPTGRELRLEHR
jgi:asparagine synthetase B (glutamine-hydrolysing)